MPKIGLTTGLSTTTLSGVKKPAISVKPTSIFTPKVGGTELGNALRDAASKLSGGTFGTGAMLRKEGESDADYLARTVRALGAASGTFNSAVSTSASTTDATSAFKEGVINNEVGSLVKDNLTKITLFVTGGILLYKYFQIRKN